MKRLISLFLLFAVLLMPVVGSTVNDQQLQLEKVLNKYEQVFSLQEYWIDLKVLPKAQMKDQSAWGDCYFDENGAHIEVMDANDMPHNLTSAYRQKFQKHILQHEVMHIYMTAKGVPEEMQDPLIHLFQQLLKD